MKRDRRNLWVLLAITLAAGAVAWALWVRREYDQLRSQQATPPVAQGPAKSPAGAPDARPAKTPPPAASPVHVAASQPTRVATTTSAPASSPTSLPASSSSPLTAAEAKELYGRGLKDIDASRFIEARAALSRAFFSGKLDSDTETQAVAHMTDLFDKTVRSPQVLDNDPYCVRYIFNAGDKLEGEKGVERTQKLHIPARFILQINNLARGADIHAGQAIKLVQGPFHAIVYKSRFIMDLYLQREDKERVFALRLPVGLGKNGSTPVGEWKVWAGHKTERGPWYPPPSSGLTGPIYWGDPKYAFGPKGLWIALKGTDPQTSPLTEAGYGIHSTNDPNSIGSNASLGCIRLRDNDIDTVYSMLYDEWSTVQILP